MIAARPLFAAASAAGGLVILCALVTMGSGCDRYDACDSLCAVAHAQYESCLDAEGRDWGDSAEFSSEEDFDNWCGTWTTELRLLATSASNSGAASDALQDSCLDKQETLQLSDCDAFFAVLMD